MLSLLILLCNRQNIAEYEAYWLMGVPIINPWGAPDILSKIVMSPKSLQTSTRNIYNFTVNWDYINRK